MSLQERQAELIDTHRAVQDEELPYVLVGGWAISAFQTRFTTDVDMVVPETELDAYDAPLKELGYSKAFDTDVANVYRRSRASASGLAPEGEARHTISQNSLV